MTYNLYAWTADEINNWLVPWAAGEFDGFKDGELVIAASLYIVYNILIKEQ